jgi:hypothetical protein
LHPVSFSNYGSQTPTQIAKHGGILWTGTFTGCKINK